LLEELAESLVVFVEPGPRGGTVTLVVGEQEAAQVYTNFSKPPGDISQHRNACELGIGDKPAAILDF
jgi:hypothetical protein